MISVGFYIRNDKPYGFVIEGHSGSANAGQDIVCAAVSSAAYMAANTVTDILHCDVDAVIDDGYMKVMLKGDDHAAEDIFDGLRLHVSALSEEYPDFIRIITEV